MKTNRLRLLFLHCRRRRRTVSSEENFTKQKGHEKAGQRETKKEEERIAWRK